MGAGGGGGYKCQLPVTRHASISVADPGRPPTPLFLDQTETRRVEKHFFNPPPPPYLRVWMTAPLLFEGLDPPMDLTHQGQFLTPDSQIRTYCS